MDADAEAWRRTREFYAGGEGRAIREQGRAGDDAVAVGFGDAAIYAFGPAKVIRIDDEILHRFFPDTCQKGARFPSRLRASGKRPLQKHG